MSFEKLHEDWEREAPKLTAVGKGNPFTVPQGYFEGLEEKIKVGIAVESLKSTIPTAGFSTPDGYFEKLTSNIESRIQEQHMRSEVPVRRMTFGWVKYAAAACITAVIGVGAYLNFSSSNLEKQFDQVPDQEIVNYLQINSDPGDNSMIMENVSIDQNFFDIDHEFSKTDLEEYINSTTL